MSQVWVLHDGKQGMRSQVLGLAEALALPFVEKRLVVRAPWRHLMPSLWVQPLKALSAEGDLLTPPWPDVIISCGRNTVAPARAVKAANRGHTLWVHIQDPRAGRQDVDLMVVPEHDRTRGENVILTRGAVHRVTPAKLAEGRKTFAPTFADLPRPLVSVLLGGNNKVYRLTLERLGQVADDLVKISKRGYGLAITPSRRTGEAGLALLREKLAGRRAFIWDGTGENPYFGLLGLADAILVTGDSVSMVSEAGATGKPVHVIELEGGSTKFRRFHDMMEKAGVTRPFRGQVEQWSYPPLNDTAKAAAIIRDMLLKRAA